MLRLDAPLLSCWWLPGAIRVAFNRKAVKILLQAQVHQDSKETKSNLKGAECLLEVWVTDLVIISLQAFQCLTGQYAGACHLHVLSATSLLPHHRLRRLAVDSCRARAG